MDGKERIERENYSEGWQEEEIMRKNGRMRGEARRCDGGRGRKVKRKGN